MYGTLSTSSSASAPSYSAVLFNRLQFLNETPLEMQMEPAMRKVAMKYRFHRKRKSYAISKQRRQSRADRVTPFSVIEIGGDAIILARFGLEAHTLQRVWQKVREKFESYLDVSVMRGLSPQEVFMMLVQWLFTGQTYVQLGENWGLSHTSVGQIFDHAFPALRASITSTCHWPPREEDMKSVFDETLGRNVTAALDCRFQIRNRANPGQDMFYRGDKKRHGLSVQLLCGIRTGTCEMTCCER